MKLKKGNKLAVNLYKASTKAAQSSSKSGVFNQSSKWIVCSIKNTHELTH